MTTVTLSNGTVVTGDKAVEMAWDALLASVETWEKAELSPVVWSQDFSLDGELRGLQSHSSETNGCNCTRDWVFDESSCEAKLEVKECAQCARLDFNASWTMASCLTDTTALGDDNGRWEHLRDAHLVEMEDLERQCSRGLGFGENPRFQEMRESAKERQEKFAKVMQWIKSAPKSALLKRRGGYAKTQRNLGLAKELGFQSIPKGKWDGVQWDAKLGTMVRRMPNGILKMADMSRVAWTKEQAESIDSAIAKRLGN